MKTCDFKGFFFRSSPFASHNNYGAGFVDDGDRVSLVSIEYASGDSIGTQNPFERRLPHFLGAKCRGLKVESKADDGSDTEVFKNKEIT